MTDANSLSDEVTEIREQTRRKRTTNQQAVAQTEPLDVNIKSLLAPGQNESSQELILADPRWSDETEDDDSHPLLP